MGPEDNRLVSLFPKDRAIAWSSSFRNSSICLHSPHWPYPAPGPSFPLETSGFGQSDGPFIIQSGQQRPIEFA